MRTSFVTVERSGQLGAQLGLKKDNSGDSSLARRRTSFSIDETEHPQLTAERKESIASEFQARKNSTMVSETIPESAIAETPAGEPNKQLGAGSGTERGRNGSKEAEKTVDTKKVESAEKGLNVTGNATKAPPANSHANGSSKPAVVSKNTDKVTTAKIISKPAAISTSKLSPAKGTKSATPTPTTPTHRRSPMPTKTPDKKASRPSAQPNAAKASKPTTTTTSAPKARIPPSPPQTGFHKPEPKPPTKPVQLPASLTAHTASSGSKTANATSPASRQSLSRASGSNAHDTSRTQSRAHGSTADTGLGRKPSTLNRSHSRPSLGPPPSALQKKPSRQSLPKEIAPADEGFLARMMRPTTASASKTAEKAHDPPLQRAQSVRRPVTRDGSSKVHEVPKAAVPKTTKPVASTKPVVKPKESTTPAKDVRKPATKETNSKKVVPHITPKATPAAQDSQVEKKVEEPRDVVESEVEPAVIVDASNAGGAGEKETVEASTPIVEDKNNEVAPVEHAKIEEGETVKAEEQKDEPQNEPKEIEEVTVAEPIVETQEEESPITESTPAPIEATESIKEPEAAASPIEETAPAAEIVDKSAIEPNVVEARKEETPVEIESIKDETPQTPVESKPETPISLIEAKSNSPAPISTTESKPEVHIKEDPEDIRAKAEIAALNAELMKAALEEEANAAKAGPGPEQESY